jgi:P27 family predicted phage terminase small subunit
MGKRGPAPLPTNIVRLTGNPGKRALNTYEPTPIDKSPPDPPSFLDAYALAEWNKVCAGLNAMGVLTKIDKAILAAYCDSYSLWKRCAERLKAIAVERGPGGELTDTTSKGNSFYSVIIGTMSAAKADTIKYAEKLGMSASARRSLGGVDGGGGKGKFSGYLGGKRQQ